MSEQNPWFGNARTLEEQIQGLSQVMYYARGKSVLDIGCAEGLIGREFVRRGAALCDGVDNQQWLLDSAKEQCVDEGMDFYCGNAQRMDEWWKREKKYDVCLMLSVLHKMRDPQRVVTFSKLITRELIVIRVPKKKFQCKYDTQTAFHDAETLMGDWKLIGEPSGPRGEWVGVFRRS